jgi:hypothetical protein
MNERIKQLAEQARIKDHWSIDEGRYLTNYLDEKKFAESIVRECIKLCEYESNSDIYDPYDMGMSAKAEDIKTAIKEHFGVES